MKKLIGQNFGFLTKNVKPNQNYKISIKVTDTLHKTFPNHGQFLSDKNGILEISEYDLQGLISATEPTK